MARIWTQWGWISSQKTERPYRAALNEQVPVFVERDGARFPCKWLHADSLKCGKCLTGQLIAADSAILDECRVCGANVLCRATRTHASDATGFYKFTDADIANICGIEASRIEARIDAADHFSISKRFALGLKRLLRECERRFAA